MICTPKVRHFWRCIFFMVKKAQAKSTLPKKAGCREQLVQIIQRLRQQLLQLQLQLLQLRPEAQGVHGLKG